MKLQDYLFKNNLSQTDFSKLSGVRQNYISRYLAEGGMPSAGNLAKIQHATNGEVTVADFLPTSHIDRACEVMSEKVSREG